MHSIASSLAGRTLLVTGSTGFLAKAFVEKVLRDLPTTRLVLLVRPRTKAGRTIGAEERLEREILGSSAFRRLRAELGHEFDQAMRERVRAVEGDLTLDGLGLDEEARASLESVELIVNSAATVVFDEKVDDAVELNTRGVGRLLALARELGDAPLVHVSTAYVCGRVEGTVWEEVPPLDRVVADDLAGLAAGTLDLDAEIAALDELAAELRREAESLDLKRLGSNGNGNGNGSGEDRRQRWLKDRLVELGMDRARERGWNDTYTYTKSLGERRLVRDHGSVPACIVRPAIIESSFSEPEPGWIDGLRMADPLFAAFGKGVLKDFPARADAYVDFIPVDHVSHAMLAAAAELLASRHVDSVPVYHVATSASNPLRFERLHELTRAYFFEHPMLGRDGKPATPPDFSFVGEERFMARLERQRRLLALARAVVGRAPGAAAKRLAARLARTAAQLDRIVYYAKIYRPYCAFPARFDTARTEALFARLPADERERFDFDPRGFDWETYLQEVHLPGLRRNVLREPTAPPMVHSAASSGEDVAEGRGTRTVLSLLAESARDHASRPAVRAFDGSRLVRKTTHAELHARALGAGAALRREGVERGDRVLLLSESRPEWIIAWLGIAAAGATAVPLDVQSTPERVGAVARLTRARATILSPKLAAQLRDADLPSPLDLEATTSEPLGSEEAADVGVPVEISSETPASILFTSGTTLEPKGVVLPHRAFLANVDSIRPVLKPSPEDRLVSVLPLHHAFEFTAGTLAPLSAGASITYLETLSSDVVIAAMRHVKATFLLGVPRLYELMLEGIRRQLAQLGSGASAAMGALTGASRAFSAIGVRAHGTLLAPIHQRFGGCVRAFVSGGSPLPPDVQRGFAALGFTLIEGYGLTETAPVLTVNPLDDPRPGTVGPPLPGVDLRIHRPGTDGVGEVIVRGPNVMAGYFEDAEASARVLRGGWFHTGDLGRLDGDGRLVLTGRLKDLIVTSSGKNVYPDEVEAELGELPGVAEHAVVGVHAASGGGEEVHLVVVTDEDASDDVRRDVREAVAKRCERLPSHQRVARVHFWEEELPKTPLLKVKRSAVRARLEGDARAPASAEGGAAAAETHPLAREMLTLLARLTRQPVETLRADQSLSFDLGVDSLMRVELAASLEAAGGPRLDEEAAQELSTVHDLILVARSKPAASATAGTQERSSAERLRVTNEETAAVPAAGGTRLNGRSVTTTAGGAASGGGSIRLVSRAAAPLVRATWPAFYGGWLGLRVHGREHLPSSGPYILAANHQSHLDAGAVLTALGDEARRLHVVAARDYFFDTPWKGGFFAELLHAIPFDRRGDFRTGLDRCREALRAGEPLLIFPEGTRSPDGRLQEFRAGLGVLALELDVPVVPVLIQGTHEALPKGARVPRRRGISVSFGAPWTAEQARADDDTLAYERWRSVVEAVRQEIVHLADRGPSPSPS